MGVAAPRALIGGSAPRPPQKFGLGQLLSRKQVSQISQAEPPPPPPPVPLNPRYWISTILCF